MGNALSQESLLAAVRDIGLSPEHCLDSSVASRGTCVKAVLPPFSLEKGGCADGTGIDWTDLRDILCRLGWEKISYENTPVVVKVIAKDGPIIPAWYAEMRENCWAVRIDARRRVY